MTQQLFIIVGPAAFSLFVIWLANFQNFFLKHGLDNFYVVALLISRKILVTIADVSEYSKGQNTRLFAIDIEECFVFAGFLWGDINLSIPERIHSETRTTSLESAFLKRVEKMFSIYMIEIDPSLPSCNEKTFYGTVNQRMPLVWHQPGHCLGNGLTYLGGFFDDLR